LKKGLKKGSNDSWAVEKMSGKSQMSYAVTIDCQWNEGDGDTYHTAMTQVSRIKYWGWKIEAYILTHVH
jgi:hypothetical protein